VILLSILTEQISKHCTWNLQKMKIVYYDLETTGVNHSEKHKNVQIIQIGAVVDGSGHTFSQYLVPTCEIDKDSTKIHGISLSGSGLSLKGKQLKCTEMSKGLKNFLAFLESVGEPVILVGYNSRKFDDFVLCHNFLRCKISPKKGVIEKLGDGQDIVGPVMRQWGVAKGGGTGVKLNLAVSKLLKEEQSFPHCALTDAKYLRDVCLKVAEIKQTEVKDLLSENLRDYSKVLKICLPMERSYQLSSHNMSDSDSDVE